MDALIGEQPWAFLAASILLILAPGPDMALVARNTIGRGRTAGLQSAAGALFGVSVHVLAAVAGVSAVLAGSAAAFSALKLAGAAYLVFLGARSIIGTLGREDDADAQPFGAGAPAVALAPSSPVLQGVLSAVLNPKLAVFFLTFLPQFVDRENMPEASMLAHGAVFVALGAIWFAVWVAMLDGLSSLFRRRAVRAWMERATGVVLVGMGMRLALARR